MGKLSSDYCFFVTKSVNKKIKVRALKDQYFLDKTLIDTELNVSCPEEFKTKYPVGTIYYSSIEDLSKCSTGKYYRVKNLKKLNSTDSIYSIYSNKYIIVTEKKVDGDDKDLYSRLNSEEKFKAPNSEKDGFFMKQDSWSLLLRNIKRHVNTMIIGPTGCGKTSCVKEACSRLGLELHIFDMGSMIDPISSLLGVHRLSEGASIFDYAKFTQVIQRPCVILLDELNRSSLGTNNILFPCLDDRRCLNIEIAGGKDVRSIKVHPEVTFIATANIGSEYSGTNIMDKALVNRFFPLELGNIPQDEEKKVLINRTKIDKEKSDLIVKIANSIRDLYNKQEISQSISIRETLMVSRLVSDGWAAVDAMKLVYLPLFEGNVNEGEKSTVIKTILTF